ncbi:MAG TPA: thioredoxin family protein [Planctomycetaceae bacterium]|jgi:peroxiredoxin|nr:thioredoxin family protein [Planctomycetaceae bacterium]
MSGRRFRSVVFASISFAVLAALPGPACAAKFNRKVDVGQPAPKFVGLIGIDGKSHSLDDYKSAKVIVIAFTCNHCPVAQMYEDRFIRFAKAQKKRGVVFVAISSSLLPPDSLEKMRERATQKGFDFPYLSDPTQEIGKAYGATVTPQVFVLDRERNIAYMGKFDDDIEPEKVQRSYVREAVHALLDGKRPDPGETRATGCGIEYGKPQ